MGGLFSSNKPEAARPTATSSRPATSSSSTTYYNGMSSRPSTGYSPTYNSNTYSSRPATTTSTARPAATSNNGYSTTTRPTATTNSTRPATTASAGYSSYTTARPATTTNSTRPATTTQARAPAATNSTYQSGYSRTGYDDPYGTIRSTTTSTTRAAPAPAARPTPAPRVAAVPAAARPAAPAAPTHTAPRATAAPASARPAATTSYNSSARYDPVYCCDYCDSNYDDEGTHPTHKVYTQMAARLVEAANSANINTLVNAFTRLSVADSMVSGIPVYTLSVTDHRVCVFEPAREKFIECSRAHLSLWDIAESDIYHATSITKDSVGALFAPGDKLLKQYLVRDAFDYGTADAYRVLILPGLLLGSRVRDFEQRCAVVEQIGTFVLTMPAQNRRLKELTLKTTTGTTFSIDVKFVKKGKEDDLDKKWTVICHPPKAPLPAEVRKGSMLEIESSHGTIPPRVTQALMKTYCNPKCLIANWPLLSSIYGASGRRDYPSVDPEIPKIPLAKNAGVVILNPEQAEAVARYNCDSCQAFVVESPPGSGKTMTAAAMAVSYKGDGVQLFLSTANVPVINMALALAKLDYGSLKAIHFISSEREELMTEETRSPFSVLSLAKADEVLNEKIELLENELKYAPNDEEREKLKTKIRHICNPVYADKYDVFFATVDMIFGRLFKNNQGGRHRPDGIKTQLMNNVKRIVVDEASQLTEAALNALILCFPLAQIVLIGDSKQLPPFRYTRGEVISELAARSSLEVIKAKMNLPVIRLNRVYRASPSLSAHYSNVFYGGTLVSHKPESNHNLLSCFGSQSAGRKCLFWKVKGYQKQSGTSKVNDAEISTLQYIINILQQSGLDEKDVMIISYYEAQRKMAETALPEGYEVLTVDSAQGREKKIVIVLTTRTSVPADKGAFFSCPLRCNVAVSRHQEALIVLGHNAVASAPNWAKVLNQKYFKHVDALSFPKKKNEKKKN